VSSRVFNVRSCLKAQACQEVGFLWVFPFAVLGRKENNERLRASSLSTGSFGEGSLSVVSLQSNNLVIHSMVRCFHEQQTLKGNMVDQHSPEEGTRPHFITCTVEHDSIRLPLEHLVENQMAG
jgi:hypothetical protein